MDKQITQLIEINQFVGDECVVLASEEHAGNYKVKARDLVGEFVDDFIIVDDHLSETSANAVQNNVITAELKKIDERLDNLDNNPDNGTFNLAIVSVKTETIESGKNAKVKITDLGIDNTNTKNLAFTFSIPRGADGKDGSDNTDDDNGESFGYRTVFAFKSSKTKPSKPTGGYWDVTTNTVSYPVGWSPGDDLERPVWMANATFDYKGIVQDWTDPFEVSGSDGENGINGQPNDGSDNKAKEFIYKQTAEEESPKTPVNNKIVDNYVPVVEGWSDHPNGVSEEIQYEWICTRDWDKTQLQWSDWNGPVLWSKYGVNGKDGDGVEYVYQLTSAYTRPVTPGTEPAEHSPVTSFQEREFIPKKADSDENEWTDNPLDVTVGLPYEWVSVRKFNWSKQQWGLFQEPTVWAKYGKDGGEGIATFKSLVFCRTNKTPIAPEANQEGGSYSNPVPTSAVRVTDSEGNVTVIDVYWEDGIPTGDGQIWMTSRIFSADGKLPQQDYWTTPQPISDTADIEVMYSPNIERINLPDGFNIDPDWKNKANRSGWYYDANEWGSSPTVWMATNKAKNGIWQGWQILKVLGEKGADGTSINILGSFDNYEQLIESITDPNVGDSYLINGDIYIWDGDSWVNGGNIKGSPGKGVIATNYRYAISKYNVYNSTYPITGEWLAYSPSTDPTNKYLWKETVIKYGYVADVVTDTITYYEIIGTHGDKGIDGNTIEYIYKLTENNYNVPDAPISGNSIDTNIKGNWTDDPQDVSATYPYQWISERTRHYDVDTNQMIWSEYSTPALFSMYAESITGETGKPGPIVYPAGQWVSNGGYIYKETAVPYVFDDQAELYYVLTAEDNNPSTRPSNNTAWLKMETFNAIYADIGVFGNALVGKAVFNGNYMFSQNGNGQYKDFDGSKIYKEGSPFDPAWCVNLVTGEQWSGTGAVYFAADGSGYLANKKISWGADGTLKLPPTGNINCSIYEYGFGVNYANIDFSAASGGGNYKAHVILTGYQTTAATTGEILFENNVMLPYGSSVSVGSNATLFKKYDLKVDGEIVATLEKNVTNPEVKDFDWVSYTSSFTIELVDVVADRHQINGNYLQYIGDSCTIKVRVKNVTTGTAKFKFDYVNLSGVDMSTKTFTAGQSEEYSFTTTSDSSIYVLQGY